MKAIFRRRAACVNMLLYPTMRGIVLLAATITLASPVLFGAAALIAIAATIVTLRRRPAVQRSSLIIAAIALLLFVLAAGDLTWHRPAEAPVVVMVDLSASTRGAAYRDRAALDKRIRELLGSTPYQTLYFAQSTTAEISNGAKLPDLPGERTIFSPPAAVAIVLFSDARFELPATAPPTFIVPDPNLDQPDDAAVSRLEVRGNQLAASIRSSSAARHFTLDAAATQPTASIEPGQITLTRPIKREATFATASLNQGDLWPENDTLSLPVTPPMRTQKWWVSSRPAPGGDWKVIGPQNLPLEAEAYLAPSIIALDNLAAGDLSAAQQTLLEQFVRDLGGALLIGGGERAFSGGLYSGSVLESLSPLASTPPNPTIHWMLLADSSGSMSQRVGNTTRWGLAAGAISQLLPVLPPEDPVSIGSFAAELNWWTAGKSAKETAALALPPKSVSPSGPTNLAAALDRIATEAAGGLATQLLVVSDADTNIDRPDELAAKLKGKNIHLHLLAIGDGSALDVLGGMTKATGGTLRRQLDPREWEKEVRQLLQAAWPDRLVRQSVTLKFAGDVSNVAARTVSPWNRTWLKKSASSLANTAFENQSIALAGRWGVGAGEVIAAGFTPTAAEVVALSNQIARPPRDPDFTIHWEPGERLGIRIDAQRKREYLNHLKLSLEITPEDSLGKGTIEAIPQTAPGHYELSLAAPRQRSFASVIHERRVLDRIPVAARYAAEFDQIGNDYSNMRRLASQSGGKIIDRVQTGRIDLPFPRRELRLAPYLALGAGVALALSLARWRVGL